MKLRAAFAVSILLASAAVHAAPMPEQARAMAGFRMSMLCLAQDPAYEQSPIGREVSASPGFKDWSDFEARPLVQCLRARKFVDKSLCDDLMATVGAAPAGGDPVEAINAAMDRHATATLESAGRVFDIEDAAGKSPGTFACPATLPNSTQ